MQFHVDVLVPPILDAAAAILCVACLVPAQVRAPGYEQHLLLLLLFFLLRAADAISCGCAC